MKREFFPTEFRKNTQISNSKKIRPVGAELFVADMTKLMGASRSYAKAPKY